MLTTSNEERDIIETYRLGVNSYIVKPVDFEQFNEVAKHLGYYWLLAQPPTGCRERIVAPDNSCTCE